MPFFKAPRHGVFAANGRNSKGILGVEAAEQSLQHFAPGFFLLIQAAKVFLAAQVDMGRIGACGNEDGDGLYRAVGTHEIRRNIGQLRTETIGQKRSCAAAAIHGQSLGRNGFLRGLIPAPIRKKHRGTPDAGVKLLNETLLQAMVGLFEPVKQCYALQISGRAG